VLLVFAYLIPAGFFYWLFFVRANAQNEARNVQQRRAPAADLRREVRDSLIALAFFTLYSMLLLRAITSGLTMIYWRIGEYPIYFIPIGFIVAVVAHDTYFYWTHRLIHWRPLFKHVHWTHHRSRTPTPWSMLAFQPLETIPQFVFFVLLVFLIPMHPATFFAYFMYDGMVNAAGHSGHEVVPDNWRNHRLMKYFNAVAHHDLHHTQVNCNYSQYFNIWDRLLRTFVDRDAVSRRQHT
jgi:sterol desaturase/sphingolipid hydroxylase (fatty acid hydroxylase superfamily)